MSRLNVCAAFLTLLALSLFTSAVTYGINFSSDRSGSPILKNTTECGDWVWAVTNLTCTAAHPCRWEYTLQTYNVTTWLQNETGGTYKLGEGPPYDINTSVPYLEVHPIVGANARNDLILNVSNTTDFVESGKFYILPPLPHSWEVGGKPGDPIGENPASAPTSVLEGGVMDFVAVVYTKRGDDSCNDIRYNKQGDTDRCSEDVQITDMWDSGSTQKSSDYCRPFYPTHIGLAVSVNQTVTFRNWTRIFEGIASGVMSDAIIKDAARLAALDPAPGTAGPRYIYSRDLTQEACSGAQSAKECPGCTCLRILNDAQNYAGLARLNLTGYRNAVSITSNFSLHYFTKSSSGNTESKDYPGIGIKSFTVNVDLNRPPAVYSIKFNESQPFESEPRNFKMTISAMDTGGFPTDQWGRGDCAGKVSCSDSYCSGGSNDAGDCNSISDCPPNSVDAGVLSVNVSSAYATDFIVNITDASGAMTCDAPSSPSETAGDLSWKIYKCKTFTGSFMPKTFYVGVSKPGLYKVAISSPEGIAKDPTCGDDTKLSFTLKGARNLLVQGAPRSVGIEAPGEWFEWVPFDINLSLRDGAGKVVTGLPANISLNVTDLKGYGYFVTNESGVVCTGSKPCNCTTDVMTGKCSMRLKPQAPPNYADDVRNGLLLLNATTKEITIGTTRYKPTPGTKEVKIWESQCANFTVSPPDGPPTAEDAAIAENLSYLVGRANDTNTLVGPGLVGYDTATGRMVGNKSVCFDQSKLKVELCVNDSNGMFVNPPGAGIFCVKEFTYTPEVDGVISDHFQFSDANLSRRKLLETFYYPRLVWGWGFVTPDGSGTTCGDRRSDRGYKITFTGTPTFPGTGDYFNVSAGSVNSISLPSYNITTNPPNPHEIRGMEGLLVADDTAGGALRLFDLAGTYREKYPFYADDYTAITPNSLIADNRGNLFMADTGHKRIIVFKLANVTPPSGATTSTLPTIQKIMIVPNNGGTLLAPQAATGAAATDYEPMGLAIDTWGRLFIAGLTNPGQPDNYLVIQVYGSELTNATANFSEESPNTVSADISVDPQGVFIYIADGQKRIRQFTFDPSNDTEPIQETQKSDTSLPQSSGAPNQGYSLYIPCRHLGGGCWDSDCRTTAENGGNTNRNGWWDVYSSQYAADACSVDFMEKRWKNDGTDNWAKMYEQIKNVDCLANDPGCYNIPTAQPPETDSPDADHEAVAVFYKRGYVFVIDKLTYDRQEAWGGCADTLCGCKSDGDCNNLIPQYREAGCGSFTPGMFSNVCYRWGLPPWYECWNWAFRNRCGTSTTFTRTEYWVRVFREDQTKNNELVPIYHGAFNDKTYTPDPGNEQSNSPVGCGDPNGGEHSEDDCISGNFPYADTGDYLWAGQTRTTRGGSTADNDSYGWNFTAGRGNAQLLGIPQGESATGLFVDDDYNIYITVAGPLHDSTDAHYIYKVPFTPSPTGGLAVPPLAPLITSGTLDGSGNAVLNTPHDVLAYPDIIKQTLSQGVFCQGCAEKGAMDLDVCKKEESAVHSAGGVTIPGGALVKPRPPAMVQVWLNTTISAQAHVLIPATIDTIKCSAPGTSLATHSPNLLGYSEATSNSLKADVEGGLFKLAFNRPYRPTRDPKAPHTLPILDYLAYSSRLMVKHFVVMDNLPSGVPSSSQSVKVCGDDAADATDICTLELVGQLDPAVPCVADEALCGTVATAWDKKHSCNCSKGTSGGWQRVCGNDDQGAKDACTNPGGSEPAGGWGCQEDEELCGQYATAFTARYACGCKTNAGMVNSSYRFNYTLMNNSPFGYQYVVSNVDIYANVSSTDKASPDYDESADPYMPDLLGFPNGVPFPSGYENTSVNWSFVPQFIFAPEHYVDNPLPLLLAGSRKLSVCSELLGTAHGSTVTGTEFACGEPDMHVPASCSSLSICQRFPGACTAAGCTAQEGDDNCWGMTGQYCRKCTYTIAASTSDVTNSPVIVTVSGYNSSGAAVTETFDSDEKDGRICGTNTWMAGDRGYDWVNITKVLISGPRLGDTVVAICASDGCSSGQVWFNATDRVPRATADHSSAIFSYVPKGTSMMVTYPPKEVPAPADQMDGRHGYALKIQPIIVSAAASITINGFTRVNGLPPLRPINGFGSMPGSAETVPLVEGSTHVRFSVTNKNPPPAGGGSGTVIVCRDPGIGESEPDQADCDAIASCAAAKAAGGTCTLGARCTSTESVDACGADVGRWCRHCNYATPGGTATDISINVTYYGLDSGGADTDFTWEKSVAPQAAETVEHTGPEGQFNVLDSIIVRANGTGAEFRFEHLMGSGYEEVCIDSSPYLRRAAAGDCYYVLDPGYTIITNGSRFIPERDATGELANFSIQAAAANFTVPPSGPFYQLTDARGTGGWFGDKYLVWQDTKVQLGIATLAADNSGNGLLTADSLYDLTRSPSKLWVSAHKYLCCNVTQAAPFDGTDSCRECKDSSDPSYTTQCALSLYPADALDCNSKTYYNATTVKGTATIIGRKAGTCTGGRNNGKPCGTILDCPGGGTCTGAELVSESVSIDGKNSDLTFQALGGSASNNPEPLSSTKYAAIYRINMTGGRNETMRVWVGDTAPFPVIRNEVRDDPNGAYSRIVGLEPESRYIRVHSSNPASVAKVTFEGADPDYKPIKELVQLKGTAPAQADSTNKFMEIYTISVEGAAGPEVFDISTVPFDEEPGAPAVPNPKFFGTIYVKPFSFTPYPFQDLDGIYYFSAKDHVSTEVRDEAVLGYHDVKFIFYDRFNNTFAWDQPFNFTLPTRLVLRVFPNRDRTDSNKTHVNLTATLYYSTMSESGKSPSHLLSSPNRGEVIKISFYEYNASPEQFVRETNDNTQDPAAPANMVCTCPCLDSAGARDTRDCNIDCMSSYSTSNNQNPCTDDSMCASGSAGDYKCMGGSRCNVGDTCPTGLCDAATRRCPLTGRCMHNFGSIGAPLETNASGQASVEYEVCGWGRHRAVALFYGTRSFAPSLDIQAYYSGGLPLDIGSLAIWAPLAIAVLALIYKLYSDSRKKPSRAHA